MKYSILVITLFLSSCFVEHNKPLLIGNWSMISWTVQQTGDNITGQKMDMSFGEDDRYKVDYGTQEEVGKWWVAGNNLYTIEDGFAQKMVRITHLENDTLVFEMNRSGRIEIVTLVKK